LLYDPQLEIRYICRQSLKAAFRQFRRYGSGKVRVIARHPRSIRARHLVAPALVAWAAGALALHARRPKLILAAMSPYLVALAVAGVIEARKLDDPGAKLRLPAAFAVMHFGWGIGFWQGVGTLARERYAARGAR
jgi:hypothetical protein